MPNTLSFLFTFSEGFTLDPGSVDDPVIYLAYDSGSTTIFRAR